MRKPAKVYPANVYRGKNHNKTVAKIKITLESPLDEFGAELIRETDKVLAMVAHKHGYTWFPDKEYDK